MPSTILVTGGAGYIGSHAAVELLAAGHELVVVDNLSNSRAEVLDRIEQITGRSITFHRADSRDAARLQQIFERHPIEAVVHFAGMKVPSESLLDPLQYFDNNVAGSLTLIRTMQLVGCRTVVFSSSTTVCSDPQRIPVDEDAPLRVTNPYGRSKLMIEGGLHDLHASDCRWQVAILRYFNPVSAHESGLIGENPAGPANNPMPLIVDVVAGRRDTLAVFGADYPTPDGTGVRDFIHVMDLARGHLSELDVLMRRAGLITVNLGTGRWYSVLQMVREFERQTGRRVRYRIEARRPGDVAVCYADATRARELLGWQAGAGWNRCAPMPGAGDGTTCPGLPGGHMMQRITRVVARLFFDWGVFVIDYRANF